MTEWKSYQESCPDKVNDYVSWRTPNEWWFIAVCQKCGRVVTSISDGGTALRDLRDLHPKEGTP